MAAIASLPMYDWPELRGAHTRFWAAIHASLPESPQHLSHPHDLWELWRSPDLWLAQTCGLPYRARLSGDVTLVGTPDYGLDGCPPGFYRSVIVVHCNDTRNDMTEFRNARLAFNEPLSQSGWDAPYRHAQKLVFTFSSFLRTGAHLASAHAVATGAADLAAIDAQSWRLMQRYQTWTKELRVIEQTEPTPGLPFITAQHSRVSEIAEAVETAIANLGPDDRDALGLKGLVKIPKDAYLAMPIPDPPDENPHKDASASRLP